MELCIRPKFWRPGPSVEPEALEVASLSPVLLASLRSFLDPDQLQALAVDLGCAERNRKHHVGLMVNALVLSALQQGPDTQGRWLDAQALYDRMGGTSTGSSSFGQRVRRLEPLFRVVLGRRVRALGRDKPVLQGRLDALADVLIPDGCAFKIAACHAGIWPGTSMPAEFKLHAVYSVGANGPADLSTSAGSVHDNDGFDPAAWVPGALYIWDLGYQDTDRFVAAVRAGAVPLQRLKDKHNPIVRAWYDEDGGRHELRRDDGRPMRLQEACEFSSLPAEGALDLDVEIVDASGRRVIARAVCVPFQGEDRWYLTTLPRDRFTRFDVAEIYRLRWEVELFFRTLRGAVRFDEVTRLRNPEAMKVALLASMVAATIGQEITRALEHLEHRLCTAPDEPPASPRRATPARCSPVPARAGFSPLGDPADRWRLRASARR